MLDLHGTIDKSSKGHNATLNGGSAPDTYNVESTAATTPVTINAGANEDLFRIKGTDQIAVEIYSKTRCTDVLIVRNTLRLRGLRSCHADYENVRFFSS